MKFSIQYITLIFILFITACGPSDEDLARVKLNMAKSLLEKQDTTSALLQLDSISALYPKAVYSANAAKNLKNEINFDVLQRKKLNWIR